MKTTATGSSLCLDLQSSIQAFLRLYTSIPSKELISSQNIPQCLAAILSYSSNQHRHEHKDAAVSQEDLLNSLSQALLTLPRCQIPIGIAFRPILLDLVARCMADTLGLGWEDQDAKCLRLLDLFGVLLPSFQGLHQLLELFLSRPQLSASPIPSLLNQSSNHNLLCKFLVSVHRLVLVTPNLIYSQFQSQEFLSIFTSNQKNSPGLRLLASKIFALLQGLDEKLRLQLEEKWIGKLGFASDPRSVTDQEDGISATLDIEDSFIQINLENRNDSQGMQIDQEPGKWPDLGTEVDTKHSPIKIDVWILNFEEVRRRIEVEKLMDSIECRFLDQDEITDTDPRLNPEKSKKAKDKEKRKGKERLQDDFMDVDQVDEGPQTGPKSIISEESLSPLVKTVGGYLLTRMVSDPRIETDLLSKNRIEIDQNSASTTSKFIETSSLKPILSQVALLYSLNLPILITGTSSSGKSSLIEHFHSLLQPSLATTCSASSILTLQLSSSSLDPNSLLGSFISSPTNPGQFEWQEGTLTRALRKGMWIVLEDIDKSNQESLSIFNSLIKQLSNRKNIEKEIELDLGNRGKIRAGKGFRIWATRSVNPLHSRDRDGSGVGGKSRFPSPNFLNWNRWSEIQLDEIKKEDIVQILNQSFPALASLSNRDGGDIGQETAIERIVSTWETFRNSSFSITSSNDASDSISRDGNGNANSQGRGGKGNGNGSMGTGGTKRSIGLRDLLKWSKRIENLVGGLQISTSNPSSNLESKRGKNRDQSKSSSGGQRIKNGSGKERKRDPFGNQVVQEEVFLEACDVFLGNIAETTKTPSMTSGSQLQTLISKGKASATDKCAFYVNLLASELGLSDEQAWWALSDRTPSLKYLGHSSNSSSNFDDSSSNSSRIQIGRVELSRNSNFSFNSSSSSTSSSVIPISKNFALTRPSLLLLERLSVSISLAEPILLVGETGTGKTTIIQHLASILRRPMIVLNLSQQTETSDLLGGFKPLETKFPANSIHNSWKDLFGRTFSSRRNARFVEAERKALENGKWKRLVGLWKESSKMAKERKKDESHQDEKVESVDRETDDASSNSRKKKKTNKNQAQNSPKVPDYESENQLDQEWLELDSKISQFEIQHVSSIGKKSLVFSFVEGPLIQAIKNGYWVLLDEINLASSETLDCLSSLLQSPSSSLTLTERGDTEAIIRHPEFRIFGCMNPSTDVGKKDLPNNLRERFTEFYVDSPDKDKDSLVSIIEKYIGQLSISDKTTVMDTAECYSQIKNLALNHELSDGANQRPHYSVRTLTRALNFASEISNSFGLRRSIFEGFLMAFTMLLDESSSKRVRGIIDHFIVKRAKNPTQVANAVSKAPVDHEGNYVQLGPFWLATGPLPTDSAEDYILTPSVQVKLIGLARAILTRKFPVLIQGPTSAGKTSAVEYLARRTGHRFVRINNHEHTDIQEYLGSYASDSDSGKLIFHEGLLVKALRRGDWIVLDELNLAPTDVLEALNRLLDDNRELILPETGEIIKPHPNFMLFATQNPPGLYAGRKVLSRAFRNRFLEVHFDDVPQKELETILTNRCKIPQSYSEKIVKVFSELQKRRGTGRVFDNKQSFVTLRDLFRWGNREAVGYEELAMNGYILLAERTRRNDDKAVVQEVIEEIMRVKIDLRKLYDLTGSNQKKVAERILGKGQFSEQLLKTIKKDQDGIVWTSAMQRLICLVSNALRYNEPVLLVGETGSGKTSVCELLAKIFGKELFSVNCHQNTDTADLLGGQRPLRNRSALQALAKSSALEILHSLKVQIDQDLSLEILSVHLTQALNSLSKQITSSEKEEERLELENSLEKVKEAIKKVNHATSLFEWRNGPLVEAMRDGHHLLLDEISLADDSVLERLNSVLEPGRTLVLAEKSGNSSESDSSQLHATDGFQVVATMNPGGDYGKKELSPALRNRFTEIWVPQLDDRSDLLSILNSKWRDQRLNVWSEKILDFVDWFSSEVGGRDQSGIGLRDLLAWATFINETTQSLGLKDSQAFSHGALLAVVDGIGALPATAAMSSTGLSALRTRCVNKLQSFISPDQFLPDELSLLAVNDSTSSFSIGPFEVPKGGLASQASSSDSFSFDALTTASNAQRVLRALMVPSKAILLEGSPGAGKTSLVTALAKATGNQLTRINLSDQTELTDLFGSDLPVEGGGPGEFAWKDAAFLRAMQRGEWVLLDEMNLASQSVLEGLNSCLDHRGSVFLPELGRSFDKHPSFRLFAAQNPHHQGGGRKGLPKSFLNRFTKAHIKELNPEDLLAICSHLYPDFSKESLTKMIVFNSKLHQETMVRHSFGRVGAPWEFNLRDLLRWLSLLHANLGLNFSHQPVDHLAALYIERFRIQEDRKAASNLFAEVFGYSPPVNDKPFPSISPDHLQIGHSLLERHPKSRGQHPKSRGQPRSRDLTLLQHHLRPLEALSDCIRLKWLAILTGPAVSGKSSLVQFLAEASGVKLEVLRMNSGVDTMDVLGTFEQMDPKASIRELLKGLAKLLDSSLEASIPVRHDQSSLYPSIEKAHLYVLSSLETLGTDKDHQVDLATLEKVLELLESNQGLIHGQESSLSSLRLDFNSIKESSSSSAGKFVWIDGPLLRAMKEGSWLLIENANMCSASVLDRLNSLFESNGSLILSERGIVDGEIPIIQPKENFRVFMTLDPRNGELSRAMRNRGMEICLDSLSTSPVAQNDLNRLQSLVRGRDSKSGSVHWNQAQSCLSAEISRRGEGQLNSSSTFTITEVIPHMTQFFLDDSAFYNSLIHILPSVEGEDLEGLDEQARSIHAAQALPSNLLPIATHLLKSFESKGILILRDVRSHPVMELVRLVKEALVNSGGIQPSLASSLPPVLDHNPLFEPASASGSFLRERFDLLIRSLNQSQSLLSSKSAANFKAPKTCNVLERSANLEGSIQIDDEDVFVRGISHIFPLLLSIANFIEKYVAKVELSPEAMSLFSSLLDQAQLIVRSSQAMDLDYSSVQVIAQSMSSTLVSLDALGVNLQDTKKIIAALVGQVSLTSGFAMHEIWSLCLNKASDLEAADLAAAIELKLACVPRKFITVALARSSIDISATLIVAQPTWSPSERADLMELGRRTLTTLSEAQAQAAAEKDEEAEEDQDSSDALKWEGLVLASLELSMRASAGRNPPLAEDLQSMRAKSFVDLVCTSPTLGLDTAIAPRKFVWAAQAGISVDQLGFQGAGMAWSARLFQLVGDGPSELYRPLLLKGAISRSVTTRVSLRELMEHQESSARLAKASALAMPTSSPSRAQSVAFMLADFVGLLTQSLRQVLGDIGSPAVHAFVQRLGQEILDQEALKAELDAFNDVLKRQEVPLSSQQRGIVDSWLVCLRQVCVALQHQEPDLLELGKAWVRLAASILQLYLPNVPVDPVVKQRTSHAFAAFQEDRIEAQIRVEDQVLAEVTNNSSSCLLKILEDQIREVSAQRSVQTQASVGREPDLTRLTQLFRELRSFVKEVADLSKLEKLLASLENGSDRAFEQEQSLQASLAGFNHRLKTMYSSLEDLVTPFLLALDQIRLGLRTIRQGAQARSRDSTTMKHELVVEALTSFPTASATSGYSKLDLPVRLKLESRSASLAAPLLLTAMAAIEQDVRNGAVLSRSLGRLSRLYDQFYQLWVLDREREEKAREEEASLYKSKKDDLNVLSDVELEEKEFKELFPEFADILEEDEISTSSASNSNSSKMKRSSSLLQSTHVQQIWSLHTSLFGGKVKDHSVSLFKSNRLEVVQKIVESSSESLKEGLDKASAAFQISILGVEAGVGSSSQASTRKDFYTSPDLKETAKAVPILQRLRERLSSLIKEWPEQMVLQHIRDRCDAILRLDSASPVAKVLAAFEQLLLHSEDWESYASSATSLKVNRSEISSLIVEWRRLELTSWAQLLEVQKALFAQSVAEWWFRLFEVAIRGFQSARMDGQKAEDQHLRKLIGLLDEFIRSSKLGEFGARLDLLRSFGNYLQMLLNTAPAEEIAGLDRVAIVLLNVNAFYQQFENKVETSLSQQRDVLERNIRDFIKLASWKDVNIHALKQSAQKTHRQLHKCIRRFRDVLRQPVDPLLAISMDGSGKDKFGPVSSAFSSSRASPRSVLDLEALKATQFNRSPSASTSTAAPHLLDLVQTLMSLRKLVDGRILPSLLKEQGSGLDALAAEIVSRSQALAKLTPAFSKEYNVKAIKSLTNRKRKAWTDLLKELRRIGLTSFLRADIPERHQDAVYVYTQSAIAASSTTPLPEALLSADQYHYRLLASLPRLRDSLRTNSGDVPLAELQRGAAFAEYAMSLGFAERSRLAALLKLQSRIGSIAKRLGGAHDSNKGSIMTCAESAQNRLQALSDFLARLDASLKEIGTEMTLHLRLSPFGQRGAEGFSGSLSQLQSSCSNLCDKFSQLLKEVATLPVPFIFANEGMVVDEAHGLIQSIWDVFYSYSENSPALQQLCRPTLDWIQANNSLLERCKQALSPRAVDQKEEEITEREDAFARQADRLISSILVVVQDLRKAQEQATTTSVQDDETKDAAELQDKAVPEQLKQLATSERCLRAETISSELSSLFSLSSSISSTSNELSRSLGRLAPFLAEYSSLLQAHIEAASAWYRSLLKLVHILTNMVSSLSAKGFCQPPPEEQNQENTEGEGGEQLEGGTGLGDGTGAQDVTDQMEDDEVMEELQKDEDEKEDKKDGESRQEKSAREADEDFGGELENVSEGEEGDEEDKGDEEDPEENDHDEQVGDVDPLDPNAVDEKMWNGDDDDDEKDDGKGQDKTEKEMGDQDQGNEESVAKDESNQQKKNSKEKRDQDQAGDQGDEENQNDEKEEAQDEEMDPAEEEKEDQGQEGEGEEGRDAEDEGEDEQNAEGLGRRLDQETKEGENLDLNEDIEMGEDGGSDSDSIGMSEEDEGMDELPPDGDPSSKQEEEDLGADAHEELDKLQDQQGDQPEEDAEGEVSRNEGEDPAEEEEAGAEEDEVEAETGADRMDIDSQHQQLPEDPQVDSNDAGMDPNQGLDSMPMGDDQEGATAQFEQSSRGSRGRQVEAMESQSAPKGQQEDNAQEEPSTAKQDAKPSGGDGRAEQREQNNDENPETKPEEQDQADSNPIRSLGDALKDFKRNLDAIQAASEAEEQRQSDESKEDGEGMPESGDVEHIKNDEEAELQAMGDANEEEQQAQKLGSMEDGTDDSKRAEETQEPAPPESISSMQQSQLPDARKEEEEAQDSSDKQQKALLPSDIKARSEKDQVNGDGERDDADPSLEPFSSDGAQLDEEMSPLPEDERHDAEVNIEQQLAEFKSTDAEERAAKAAELWRQYSALTSDLSFALCEQLRLILVPTLATRLNGDYRTGKRLNMRKIVPFIASDFAKDKIWLRRTKPSAREYQVLLAIDDSRSMAESRSSHLAYQTLALVSGALGRLEVGDVGICRFGETVETLHQFGKGTFSEEDGARVIDRLSFEQKGTNVLKLVENSLNVLQEARESRPSSSASAGAELWQLEIIISDGVCQDHDRLRALLRRAAEQRVMLVFIIVDSLQSSNASSGQAAPSNGNSNHQPARHSILSMNSVSYSPGADGRLELKMERYLDTFPFEHYVVVRDVEALPDVLAATLRQWAEKIRETE